jgi:hypothetical protein
MEQAEKVSRLWSWRMVVVWAGMSESRVGTEGSGRERQGGWGSEKVNGKEGREGWGLSEGWWQNEGDGGRTNAAADGLKSSLLPP